MTLSSYRSCDKALPAQINNAASGSIVTHPAREGIIMGIGTSLIIFAVGAVMNFAISVTTTGFNLHTIGIILMIVGGVGLLLSIVFRDSWGGFGGSTHQRRTTTDGPSGTTTTTSEERVS